MSRALRVVVDGVEMADDEARALWARFSAHMDASKGDLRGFAQAEGYASVHPEVWGGAPVLVVSRDATQRPYVNAPVRPSSASGSGGATGGATSGSPVTHGGPSRPTSRGPAGLRGAGGGGSGEFRKRKK
jgi:hypothetical protein